MSQSDYLQMQRLVGNRQTREMIQLLPEPGSPSKAVNSVVQVVPEIGQRQTMGMLLVSRLARAIRSAGAAYRMRPEMVGVIVMHESQARERTMWGSDRLADAAERAQAQIQGENASIGIGQMRVGTARELRRTHPELTQGEVVDDLLRQDRAVRYVAARLSDLRSTIRAYFSAQRVALDENAEMDLTAIAYNTGWESLRDRNLRDVNLGRTLSDRVTALRSRSGYVRFTTAYLPTMRNWLELVGRQ